MDILRPVLDQIAKLWTRLDLMPVIRWGTITQVDPLRVQLDGDIEPLILTPMSIVGGARVGERVICVEQHRRVIILGRAHGQIRAMGAFSQPAVAAGDGLQTTVTFPTGLFTTAPRVFLSKSQSRWSVAVADASTDTATITVANWTDTTSSAGVIRWQAIQGDT